MQNRDLDAVEGQDAAVGVCLIRRVSPLGRSRLRSLVIWPACEGCATGRSSRRAYLLLVMPATGEQGAARGTGHGRDPRIIRSFCADALFHRQPHRRPGHHARRLAQALLAALRARLPGYSAVISAASSRPPARSPPPLALSMSGSSKSLLTRPPPSQHPRRHPHSLAGQSGRPLSAYEYLRELCALCAFWCAY